MSDFPERADLVPPGKTSPGVSQRADYGIDAPGVVCIMFIVGAAGFGAAFGIHVLAREHRWLAIFEWVALAYGALFIAMSGYLVYWSKVGKVRGRETLLDLMPWSGSEVVLDVGCGRGLLLLAAAKRIPAGRAVGIDIWQAKDQTGNGPAAVRANARVEGVAARVSIQTADMRRLPFADESFDRVVSHWAVHNLPSPADRSRAIEEMARVLKPGGYVLLADIQFHRDYAAALAAAGLGDVRQVVHRSRDAVLAVLTSGQFRPAATIARKAVSPQFDP